jgi:hypothetical protein
MAIDMIEVKACIPPEDDPQIGSKYVVNKIKLLLILDSCICGYKC